MRPGPRCRCKALTAFCAACCAAKQAHSCRCAARESRACSRSRSACRSQSPARLVIADAPTVLARDRSSELRRHRLVQCFQRQPLTRSERAPGGPHNGRQPLVILTSLFALVPPRWLCARPSRGARLVWHRRWGRQRAQSDHVASCGRIRLFGADGERLRIELGAAGTHLIAAPLARLPYPDRLRGEPLREMRRRGRHSASLDFCIDKRIG